jgi:hypothetical protein
MATNDQAIQAYKPNFNFRGYLAGTGASGSLLVAALVAFVAVTAFVAFDAVPFGSGESGADTVALQESDGTASVAAAAAASAVGGTPGAVAAAPVVAAPGGAGGTLLAGAPGSGATTVPGGGTGDPNDPGDTGDPTGSVPGPVAVPCADGTAPPCGPLNEAVAGVDGAIEGVTGVNPNLGGATRPATGAVDDVVQGATGGAGGRAEGAVGQTVGGLLGN